MGIGDWIRRGEQDWHLVESTIDGDAITKCGRRMDRVTDEGELEVSDVKPLSRLIGQPQLCQGGCDGGS